VSNVELLEFPNGCSPISIESNSKNHHTHEVSSLISTFLPLKLYDTLTFINAHGNNAHGNNLHNSLLHQCIHHLAALYSV